MLSKVSHALMVESNCRDDVPHFKKRGKKNLSLGDVFFFRTQANM